MNELIRYFTNLLILQYRNKPKAKATIETLATNLFSNDTGGIFPLDVENAYDLDTASQKQLDVIGKYIGYSSDVDIIVDNNFKYAEYDDSVNPDTGYSEYNGSKESLPYAEYRYTTYLNKVLDYGDYTKILGFLSEIKNKILSLGEIDSLLEKYFDGLIYVVEGDKSVEYHYAQEFLTDFENEDQLQVFTQKYMPKPMGCSVSSVRDPYFLNLIPYGGAENGVDEDFIYTGTIDDVSKYFEMPYDINVKNGDTVEINIKVKINGDYTLSGFYQMKDSVQLALLKRRLDGTITATGYGYYFPLCEYADLVDEWITITLYNKPHQSTGFFATVKKGDEIVSQDVAVPVKYDFTGRLQFAIANISHISYYGFIGKMDFKECYIKKNNEYVWKGLTNKRVQGV